MTEAAMETMGDATIELLPHQDSTVRFAELDQV